MKKILSAFILSCFCFALPAQQPFVTVWKTDNPSDGGTTNTQILYPNSGGTYQLEWSEVGDPAYTGSITTTTSNTLIDFGKAGIFEVKASPAGTTTTMDFNMPSFGSRDNQKLLEVTQWGEYTWHTLLTNAFYNCINMDVTATDKPVFSPTAKFSLSGFFYGCSSLENSNGSIGDWNTGNANNLNSMFYNCARFNQNLNTWNTANVTTMESVFAGCTLFNQPLNNWNTANVTSFRSMFSGCTVFNQNINTWITAKVNNLSATFLNCAAFNQPLNLWTTNLVTTLDRTFAGCTVFNQAIGNWNVGNVIQFTSTFSAARNFNQPLDGWLTTKAQNMSSMFNFASSFNQPLPGFDLDGVIDISWMFFRAEKFNQSLNHWNTSTVENFSYALMGTLAFDQDLAGWSLQNAKNLNLLLTQSGLSCANYGKTLIAWSEAASTPNDLTLGALDLVYGPEGQSARNELVSANNWAFDGDVYDASCNESLPVVFQSISARLTDSEFLVSWTTAAESNNSHYEVQVSADGRHFKTIGTVQSKAIEGTSVGPLHYQFRADSLSGFLLSILLCTLLPARRKWVVKRALLMAILLSAFLAGCKKMEEAIDWPGIETVYVRLVQIDKDGDRQQSKIIIAEKK